MRGSNENQLLECFYLLFLLMCVFPPSILIWKLELQVKWAEIMNGIVLRIVIPKDQLLEMLIPTINTKMSRSLGKINTVGISLVTCQSILVFQKFKRLNWKCWSTQHLNPKYCLLCLPQVRQEYLRWCLLLCDVMKELSSLYCLWWQFPSWILANYFLFASCPIC